jgi:hypothetical protein
MVFLLWAAVQLKQHEERRAGYHLDPDQRPFGVVARDLMASLEQWPLRARGLLDGGNWHYQRLVDAQGTCRKPQVTLVVEITARDNLVLEWYPGPSLAHPPDASDFLHWSDQRSGYDDPAHRLVMIRDFARLGSYDPTHRRPRYAPSDQQLIEAVHAHLHAILYVLRTILDVHLDTDLYLEYRTNARTRSDQELLGFQVRQVREVEQEQREAQRQRWLRQTFHEGLGISPAHFLDTFREANYRYTTTAQRLQQHQVTLSHSQVRRLIHRLSDEHPALYARHCPARPPGRTGPALAKVLPFQRPEGRHE